MQSKLSLKTTRCYFIGYPLNAKGYRFDCPTRGTKIVGTINVKFLENDLGDSTDHSSSDFTLEAPRTTTTIPIVQERVVYQHINDMIVEQPHDDVENLPGENLQENIVENPPSIQQQTDPIRRSQRVRRPAIPDFYETYLGEADYDIGEKEDPMSYS